MTEQTGGNTASSVYAAFNSTPDYHGRGPSLKSLHETFEGAVRSLYPDREDFQAAFRETLPGEWDGPDGFGLVRIVEVQP